jgi:hypothetical protein
MKLSLLRTVSFFIQVLIFSQYCDSFRSLSKPLKPSILFNSNAGSLGAPSSRPEDGSYLTSSNIEVFYKVTNLDNPEKEISTLIDQIDRSHGKVHSFSIYITESLNNRCIINLFL